MSTQNQQPLPQPVHFIGIGGAGMSGIAAVLAELGVRVTGSDLKNSRYIRHVVDAGVHVSIGHREENLGEAALVVISSAIPETNPELRAARLRGLPVVQRAEMLARLMAMRRGIAVAGTHGKTTTSSMVSHVLHCCGRDPSFLVGGELNDMGSNAGVGQGEWLVAEADESDGSLLFLRPEVAIVTNVELDHHAHYRSLDEVRDVFRRFVALLPAHGLLTLVAGSGGEFLAAETPARVVVCDIEERGPMVSSNGSATGDERHTVTPAGAHRRSASSAAVFRQVDRSATAAVAAVPPATAALRATLLHVGDRGSEFMVKNGEGELLGRVELRLPGEHNVLNALCAIAALQHAGVSLTEAAPHLATFNGAARRFQELGRREGVIVVDDYAHHPTEIAATLRAAMSGGHNRVIAVFQPHLFSRTRYLQREFGRALSLADEAIVTDIFAAREEPEPGITGKLIVEAYLAERPGGPVSYMPRIGDAVRYLRPRLRRGDLVLTLGAGDVFRVGEQLRADPTPDAQGNLLVAAEVRDDTLEVVS
jgi:UDP-N-acetylmuramate--alanine ligase